MTGIGLVAGAVMLSGAGGTSPGALASPVPQKSTQVDPKDLPPHLSETLGDLPDSIAELGNKVYPDVYGGLMGVNGGEHVQIYLTDLNPVIEAAFEALAPTDVVSFVQSAQSLRDLETLHQAVLDQADTLSSQGVEVFSFWPDIATSTEWVGVEDLMPARESAVNKAFGADKVHVFDVPANVYENTASHMLATRIDDSRPWNAGDPVPCPANIISQRYCFHSMYYTAMNSSLGRWNGTLNTEPVG